MTQTWQISKVLWLFIIILHVPSIKKNKKNAFQSKAHLPLADRKSNTYNLTLEWPWPWYDLDLIYDLDLRQVKLSLTDVQVAKLPFSMRWPWPWPNDLDTQTWPRYGHTKNEVSMWTASKVIVRTDTDRQTDRQRDTTKTLPLPHTREVTTKNNNNNNNKNTIENKKAVLRFVLWTQFRNHRRSCGDFILNISAQNEVGSKITENQNYYIDCYGSIDLVYDLVLKHVKPS